MTRRGGGRVVPDVRVRRVARIAHVEANRWNAILPDGAFHLSHEWLSAVEALSEGRYLPSYFVAEGRSGALLAAAPCYLVENPRHYAPYNPCDLLEAAGPGVERGSLFPALLCGSASGYAGGLLADPSRPPWEAAGARSALLAEIERHADREGARIVALPYVPLAEAAVLAAPLGGTYTWLLAAAACRLALRGPTFEDYLAALGAARRHSVRREVSRFAESGLTVRVCRLHECAEALPALAANVQRRYGHQADPARFAVNMRAYEASLDGCSRVFLAERDGRPVGFSLFFAWRGRYHGRMVGFDYERLRGEASYFNLIVYLPVREALEEGVGELDLGIEGYEVKLSRGCAPLPLVWGLRLPAGSPGALAAAAGAHRAREAELRGLAGRFHRPWPDSAVRLPPMGD